MVMLPEEVLAQGLYDYRSIELVEINCGKKDKNERKKYV